MNGNKSLRKKQDNNKKLLGTILDHNNSLLKNMNSPSKPTFLSEPPIGTANKTFTTKFWYPKFQKKKKNFNKKKKKQKKKKKKKENFFHNSDNWYYEKQIT